MKFNVISTSSIKQVNFCRSNFKREMDPDSNTNGIVGGSYELRLLTLRVNFFRPIDVNYSFLISSLK